MNRRSATDMLLELPNSGFQLRLGDVVYKRNAQEMCKSGLLVGIGLFSARCFVMTAHGLEATTRAKGYRADLETTRGGLEKHSSIASGTWIGVS